MEQKHIALLKTNFDFLYGKDVEPTSELLVYTVYLLETIGINLGCRFYLSSDSRLVSDQAENIMLITDITTEEALSSTQGFHPTEQRCSALKNIINKYKTTSYSIRQWVKAVAMTTYLVQNVIASNSSSNVIIKSVSNRCPDLTDETGDLPYAKQIISCAEELLNKTQTQNIVQSSYVKIKHPHHLRKLISSCTETPYSLLVKTITDENHDTLFTKPKIGDVRTKRFFAWFPVRINKETRWLETVIIRQTARQYIVHSDILPDTIKIIWENSEFL